jgi:hypothetical protein
LLAIYNTSIDDILRTVLALYMDDENLPLPTLEEVLICDFTTTAEEVFRVYWWGGGGW